MCIPIDLTTKLATVVSKTFGQNQEVLQQIIDGIKVAIANEQTIFTCGNGGSAAQAMHFTGELVGRFRLERKSLPSVCMCQDTASLTAIANDYGYSGIFSRPLSGLGKKGDVLFALSTSGNSENINNAIEHANEMGITSIALLGKGGGKSKDVAQLSIIVDSDDTPLIQEVHLVLIHYLCSRIDENVKTPQSKKCIDNKQETIWDDERQKGEQQIPLVSGLYLARTSAKGWFDTIVRVRGEQPYLQYDAWSMISGTLSGTKVDRPAFYFGKKIASLKDLQGDTC